MCVVVPKFVPIGQTVSEISPFFDFQDSGHPPSCIFKSSNFSVQSGSEGKRASS